VDLTTIAILAKMLVAFGAKMVNAEEREILLDALLSQLEIAILIVHTSLIVSVATLFQAATGVMTLVCV